MVSQERVSYGAKNEGCQQHSGSTASCTMCSVHVVRGEEEKTAHKCIQFALQFNIWVIRQVYRKINEKLEK